MPRAQVDSDLCSVLRKMPSRKVLEGESYPPCYERYKVKLNLMRYIQNIAIIREIIFDTLCIMIYHYVINFR